MNINSLLIGSAAALVAVSGARAADAVVIPEPEPFEYVRVCDTYGVGFFYIPGTETCLRISGLIRYDIEFSEDNEYDLGRAQVWREDRDEDGVKETVRVRLNDEYSNAADYFGVNGDTREEINRKIARLSDDEAYEFALMRAAAGDVHAHRVFFDPDLDSNVGIFDSHVFQEGRDEGWAKDITARLNIDARSETEWGTFRRYIRLEGGTSHSATPEINRDDSPNVKVIFAYVELGGLLVGLYDTLYDGEMSPEFDSGGGSAAHQIRYTFNGANGWQFQVSIEEQDYNYDYTPNVVGRIGLTQGWGSAALFAAYDATFEEVGVKGLASFNITDAIALEGMATYESGYGDFSVCSANGLCGYEYSLAAALSFKATDQLKLWVGGQYFGDQHWFGHDNYTVGVQADWTVVENLLLRGRVQYNGGDSQDFVDGQIRLEAAF